MLATSVENVEAKKGRESVKGKSNKKSTKASKKASKKANKVTKSSKNNNAPDASNTCKLPKMKSDASGKPYWVQTGQVMTLFDSATTVARKTFTDEEPLIAENDQYIVKCGEEGYVPDEMCYYTCTDGVLDTTTYCQSSNPQDLCVKTRDLTIAKQCALDFDSDEPWFEGKSLKMWWKEVLDKYHFQRNEIFDRSSDVPFFLGHGAALLEGAGFVAQHFVIPAASKNFNGDAVDITSWVPGNDYVFGPDTLRNSQSDPINGFVQDLVTEDVPMGPFILPNVTAPIKDFDPVLKLTAVLRDYDPCDDSKFLGFPPECFIYHPAGFHTGDGEMFMYRSPLNNGKLDLQGVCTGAETAPPVLIDALMANMGNIADTVEKAGGFTGLHPASWSMHLCIDDDIYHPYLCSDHTNLPTVNGDYVSVDAAPFMPIPTEMRKKLCAERTAGGPELCSPQTNTTYPLPWTQYL